MSHESNAHRSPAEASDATVNLQPTHSLLVAATDAIRDELSTAQHHVTQASDLIHQLFIDIPKTLRAPLTTELPSTMLASTRTPTPTTPHPDRQEEVHEVKESPSTPAPVPYPPTTPAPATSPADLSDTEWTEERLTILASEKLNDVRRPSWKAVANKVGLSEEQCKAKWQEIKPSPTNAELIESKSPAMSSAPSKRQRTD